MSFSRRVLERRQRREEQRRQAELERRQAADLEQRQDEERRAAARLEAEARAAQLDAARAQREALLVRLRAQQRAARHAEAERAERRDALLEILHAARHQARQAELDEAAQNAQLRQSLTAERRQEQQQAGQAQARRAAARQTRLEAQRATEPDVEQPVGQRQAALRARLAEQQAAGHVETRRQAARRAQQDEQREAERAGERRTAARQSRRAAADAEAQAAQQVTGEREAARAGRRAAERRAAQESAQAEARRAERQAQAETAQQAAARRSAAGAARLAERRAAEGAAAQAGTQREAARRDAARPQARRAPWPSAEPPPDRELLQDRIPSGVLSGALPWLRVVGNRLVTLAGDPVTLQGVSLLGLERAEPHPQRGFAAGAGITPEGLEALLDWGVTIVRLALNQSRVLNGHADFSAWDYLAEVDRIIQHAARRGAYTLLSLRQLDDTTVFGTRPGPNGERLPNHIAPQPDYDTIGMWRGLGERYADEPAVLFDLYTAPHPPLPDDLTGYDSDWDLWTLWVPMMVAELRRLHPRAICWVSGLAEATDLSGFPMLGTAGDPIPNLVYAAHLYPRRANPWPALQALARTQAVFVTEWGGERGDLSWGERTALALRGSGIGWTAAHWNAAPFLATPSGGGPGAATPFGLVVQRALALAGERLTIQPPVLPAALDSLSAAHTDSTG